MILTHILTEYRLNTLIVESILIFLVIMFAFQMINKFRDKNQKLPQKVYYQLSLPIMAILIILNFLIRFLIEFSGIFTGALSFGIFHIVGVLISHLILYKKDSFQKRTGDSFDFYAQYSPDYKKIILLMLGIGILFQILRIVESLLEITLIYITMKENYLFSLIVILLCILVTKFGNLIINEKKRMSIMSLNLSSLLASVLCLILWGSLITIYGLIMKKGPFEIHGFSFLILLYISSFSLIGNIISRREKIRFEIELLEEFESKTKISSDVKSTTEEIILSVQDLTTYFYTEEGIVKAVEGVSFDIYNQEILGLVGETGCGKSVTALSVLRLVRSPGKIIGGKVLFQGDDLLQKSEEEMLKYRGNQITMMFQDPLNSINPIFKVGDQIAEVFHLHKEDELVNLKKLHTEKITKITKQLEGIEQKLQKPELATNETLIQLKTKLQRQIESQEKYTSTFAIAREQSIDLLRDVGIPDPELIFDRYPHELSGGMRQRIMIAMGLACSPKLLLADEPTTALDVTIQAQILDLIKQLRKKYHTSILFITHDLGIISQICDRVAVMYSGYIVEYGKVRDIFRDPKHPYTQGLIQAIPKIGLKKDKLVMIPGTVPNLVYPPSGCRFHPRCKHRFDPCDKITPQKIEVGTNTYVSCHLFNPEYSNQEAEE